MTSTHTTEAAAVAEIVRASWDRAETIAPHTDSVQSFVTRDNERRETDSFERYLGVPRRPRGTTSVIDVDSFAALVERLGTPDTVLFANQPKSTVTAIVNYDNGWRDHRLALNLELSPEWLHWAGQDGKLLRQVQFAEHIEDGLASVVEPPAADLLEIAQTFQAKRSLQFESGTRLNSGDVQFRFHEETSAGAGQAGDIAIPETIRLQLPLYRNGAIFPVTARLRYRIAQEGLVLGYKLDRPDDLLQAGFTEVVGKLTEQLGDEYLIVHGVAPEPVREI
ncbi:DUF2303 family protein [Rhodococcus sp. NPDC003318]|uniref:DUF2303 family protein n=1 Tax=Rhodococcus sp. NPDC003318 TaxID=3364503 RepID=UPI003694500C